MIEELFCLQNQTEAADILIFSQVMLLQFVDGTPLADLYFLSDKPRDFFKFNKISV